MGIETEFQEVFLVLVDVVFPYVSGRGGMEKASLLLEPELLRLGVKLRWLFPGPALAYPEWVRGLSSTVVHYQRPAFASAPSPVASLRDGLAAFWRAGPRPDVVLATTMTGVGIYAVARQALGVFGSSVPRLVSWQRASLRPVPPAQRSLLRVADAHLVPSHGLAQEISAVDPGKPIATTGSPILQTGVGRIPRAKKPTFVYVGRIDNRQKRLDRLFLALGRLKPGSFHLHIVGGLPGDGEAAELHRLAERLSIAQSITWTPWQEDPWEAIPAATAFVLTSDYEGFGLVLGEALARGLPVVASDCPHGPRDIVLPGVNGWLFPPDDIDALAGLLSGIADGSLALPDPEVCARSVARFHPRRVAERMVQALERFRRA